MNLGTKRRNRKKRKKRTKKRKGGEGGEGGEPTYNRDIWRENYMKPDDKQDKAIPLDEKDFFTDFFTRFGKSCGHKCFKFERDNKIVILKIMSDLHAKVGYIDKGEEKYKIVPRDTVVQNKKLEYNIEGFNSKFKKITYLNSGKKVSIKKSKEGLSIHLDDQEIDYIDTILKMEL